MTDYVNPLFKKTKKKLYVPPIYSGYVQHCVTKVCLNVFVKWPFDKENTTNLYCKMFFLRFGETSIHK